jgi:hypothetical protein
MDLEKTEARNDCADKGKEHFNRPTDWIRLDVIGRSWGPVSSQWQLVIPWVPADSELQACGHPVRMWALKQKNLHG